MAAGVLLMSWVIVVELAGVVVPWPLVPHRVAQPK